MTSESVRVAVEGCGHGTLNAIYTSVQKSCEVKGWPGVDLLIIGGDFQAVRNSYDLNAMSMPMKYREIGDFHLYYSGARKAPYLTLFIGGNHEASNHLSELFYGGWVAPNIYYMGAANVIRFGPLRIVGLSGIWKGYSYNKPHFERVPYDKYDDMTVYHVREIDTRRLLCLKSQVDIALSHDWPRGVEWLGNWKMLFRDKGHFESDARSNTLGSVAAKQVLDHLRPYYWFSAHLHCKYSALVRHNPISKGIATEEPAKHTNNDEIDVDLDDSSNENAVKGATSNRLENENAPKNASTVPQVLKDQLPASFRQSHQPESMTKAPVPDAVTNTTTRFLALDKCLPNRRFLQLLSIDGNEENRGAHRRPFRLSYDEEWLAITRTFASDIKMSTSERRTTKDKGEGHYRPIIEKELSWVVENIVKKDLGAIPENFDMTAPPYDASVSIMTNEQPESYSNPQTERFCKMLQIVQPFS